MQVRAIHTALFAENDDLITFIRVHIQALPEGSILAIASKIVALSEGRVVEKKTRKEQLIRRESEWMLKVLPKWWLTVRDGSVVVNAGIDASNVHPNPKGGGHDQLILLPEDSFASAARIRGELQKLYGVRELGIVITDSRITPLRAGVVGIALGYAGFRGVRDYRGSEDLFGRPLEVTQTDIADSLATAATVVMGEGAERQPLALVTDAPVEFCERTDREELRIPMKHDLYKKLFALGVRTGARRTKERRATRGR